MIKLDDSDEMAAITQLDEFNEPVVPEIEAAEGPSDASPEASTEGETEPENQ